jgi:Asp-tRNA(Asn)/Glu-tRNA(Gln) amidotransferase A subunit family amidase
MFVPLLFASIQSGAPADDAPFGALEIGVAADVLGLHFSEKELVLMLPDVLERLREFEQLRAVPLANDVAPVLVFVPQPEPSGSLIPAEVRPARAPERRARPADLEELAYAGIPELAALVRQRDVSCVELAETFLARLERLDPRLHCVVTLTKERALAQAKLLDAELAAGTVRGPLHGIPWVAKDLLAVKGYPTTWGTAPFRAQAFEHDAAVVEKLDAAGAVLLAKVSLGELAWGDVWFGGTTRNPWKLEQGSSGSSAGSASAVAAGCAAFALGSETYGSIVSPSTVCGNSSLRPTFGRVSRHGAMTLCWSLDKLGPICRSAEDAGLVLAAIAGPDARDASTVERALAPIPADVRGWRVGVPKGAFAEDQRCTSVLAELETLGVELVELELPDYPVDAMMIVLAAEAGAAFDELSRGTQDDAMARQTRDAWPNVLRQASLIPAVDYIRANRLRTLLIRDLEATFAGVKALVHPSFASGLLAATNLAGHPTLVAPCGFGADGTPYSISFTGRLFGEAELLALAAAWQRSTDYHTRHPKL